ncbi:MAG TPA: efflux RND transporter periplasmic adaptor subunit, partial [Clostridia bacterium]|nr:efflux RND transporter periplasmic adaptor subunit [Clostridia bacterium]
MNLKLKPMKQFFSRKAMCLPASGCPRGANRFLGVAGTVGLSVMLVTGCGKSQHTATHARPELPPAQVRTQTIESRKLPITEEVVGTVQAKTRARLEAKINGRISRMPVVLGEKVKAGQLIASLDVAEIKARAEQADAGMQQAEREWKRISALFEQQAVTRSERDAAESRYLVAKAAVAEAKAMSDYLDILAPFDGVVTRKWAEAGDLAMPGKPLVDLENPAALQLEADVPEAIAPKIQRDAQMVVRIGLLTNELVGTVSEIAPAADPLSRTSRIKLDLPSTPGLMPGQFARLVVPVGEGTSLRVPSSAVIQRGQL